MGLQVSPYTWPLLVVVGLDLALAGLCLRRREEPGAIPLAAMMLAVGLSTLFYVLMLDVTSLGAKVALMRASYAFIVMIPVAWTYFAIRFTGRDRWITPRTMALLAVEPVVLFAGLLTPASWGLINRTPDGYEPGPELAREGSLMVLEFVPGPLMAMHFSYHYLVFAIGTLLFVAMFVRARHLYRAQAGAMLAGALIPWAGNALYLTGLFDEIHLFPVLLTASGVAFTLALYRFRLLDPVPTARKAVVEEMGDGVLVIDERGRIGDANPAARRLLFEGTTRGRDVVSGDRDADGTATTELTGRHAREVLPDWESIADEQDEWHEVALDHPGSTGTRYLEVEVTPFEDHHERDVGRLVVLRDVTGRKRREKRLARYKTIFETVQDRVYVLDGEDRFAMVNRPFAAMLGYDPGDLVGKRFSTIVGGVEDPLDTGVDTGSRGRFELTAVTADGERIPCETELSPIAFADGDGPTGGDEGTVGVIRDISRRRAAERSLKETSHRLRALVESSPLAIISIDDGGTVDVWNPAAERIFGWGIDEVVGEEPPFLPADGTESEVYASVRESLLEGDTVTGVELSLRTASGDQVEASISGAPIYEVAGERSSTLAGRGGTPAGAVMVVADVTERKERERQLRRQNEKLEQFASMLSHDLRNPLSVAQGFTEMARERDDPDAFERIERAHDRMGRIIDDLLSLARQGESVSETRQTDLEELARSAWEVVDTAGMGLTVEDTTSLEADPERLQEAFENLFRNAREHAGADVHVWVGTSDDGFYVADDGPGIAEDQREDVFEHGFTTATEGTGFGLAIVQEVVGAHGWSIVVGEGPGGGARFDVRTGADGSPGGASEFDAEDAGAGARQD